MRKSLVTLLVLSILLPWLSWNEPDVAWSAPGGQTANSWVNSLFVLDVTDMSAVQRAINVIVNKGGHVVHLFPTHVLIGYLPPGIDDSLVGQDGIKAIYHAQIDIAEVYTYGELAQIGVSAWNNIIAGRSKVQALEPRKDLPPIQGDALPPPPRPTTTEGEVGVAEVSSPEYGRTSEYLIGKVAIGIILPESNGSAENWTPERRTQVADRIIAGANWWAAREARADLSFIYDVHFSVPTNHEPIQLKGYPPPDGEENVWIWEVLAGMGSSGTDYMDMAWDYVNTTRATYQADWAFAVFVVDSLNDSDGQFSNGKFAYAYVGGPFVVMTYDNNGYGIENMDAVLAHEMGHIFWALDQYYAAEQPCTKRSGYLNVENQNSEYGDCLLNVDSIMRGGVAPYVQGQVDQYARGQVGWWDEDGNGTLDPLDKAPPSTDNATFLSHITLPDGSAVSPGQALVKTWRVKNTGTSTWNGYKLRFIGGDPMNAPTETSIQNTAPQSTVDISINLTAPTQPGNYSGYFQIINASGTEVPGGRLSVKISVQAEESHITFYFDPPSPSAANNVYIKAKAEGIENVRAMRLLIDGQIVSELGATCVDANWDTRAYVDGLHSIVAQVAFWGDDGWAYPEQRGVSYELLPGRAPANKAPNPPTLTQPGDWHVGWSIPQLCAQHNGDPDGDTVTHYYFEIFESFQNWNSGWITGNCVTPSGLASTNYQWHVKVRDSHGAESDWSQAWHFSYLDPTPQITQFDFDPPSPSNAEEVWIHTNGTGNVNETIVDVNMATDCSDDGEWHGINHFAGGLDVYSYWSTLDIPAGCHKVRVQLRGVAGVTYQDRDYVLNDPRRPKVPYEIYPVRDQWVNTRTVTFRWKPSLRQNSYRLIASTNSDPGADPSPLVNQTWTTNVTAYTATFPADYAALYYRIQATNAQGSTDSTVGFGIDTTPPGTSMAALPATSLDTQIPVSWSASDTLSGVRWYDVQVRDGLRGEWADWLVHTTRTSEIFPARPGHTYYFQVQAMDVAGNTSSYPGGNGHTHTLVDPTAAPPTAWWNGSYGLKRNVLIINQDGQALPVHFPIHLHFDSSTSPTAQALYDASLSSTQGDDVRVVYNDTTELDRFVQRFSATQIDIWFPLQAQIAGSGSDGESYQLYYGNASAGSPPADVNDVFLPVADANTIGLWHFQDGSGSNVTDTSGRGHHGAFQNAAWTDGWLGWAGSFNGSSAYVDAGNSNDFNLGNGPMTIEAWIYLTGNTGNYPHVVSKWGPGDGSYFFRINNLRELHWLLRADGGNREVVTWGYDPLELNTWYHVAVTYDGSSTMRSFIDGQQKRTNTNAADAFNSTRRLFIGWAEQGADGGYFPGYIQHVRISNVERTSFPYGRVTNAPSVAAGSAILPPSSGSANLVLQSLSTYPVDSETLEGSMIVQAIVKNDGDAPTVNGFYTDFYTNHLPTGGGDLNGSIGFLVNESVVAGATVTLTTVISDMTGVSGLSAAVLGPSSETTVTLYTQADSEGVVTEPDEADNISSGVEVCVASADAYESDNTFADAQSITLGGTQRHNFDSLSDQDRVKFAAQGGATYTIRTSDLGPSADTYLYLYDTDGSTLLAANDDYGGSLASRIEWTSPMTGTYYVLVKHWNPTVAGCGTGYDLTLEKALANRIYLPVVSRNFAPSTPWPGNALSLNGVDGYVLVNDNNSLDGFSGIAVEAWVRTNNSSGARAIVSKYRHYSGSNWDDSFYLSLSGGRVEWQLNAGDWYSIVNGNTNVADGQWHHIAGTWDGTNQAIYVDGNQDASRTYSGNGQINSTDEPITIGRSIDFSGPGRYLSGQIDDVRIWNLARSQQDIRSTRFRRLQGNEAGLIAYWPMDEAIGSTAVPDVSGHSNDGTLQGGAGLVVSTVPTN